MNAQAFDLDNPSRPLISVIMPCYNAGPYLEEAIYSALRQSYGNIEVVLVDDGSTDESVEIATRLAANYPDQIIFDSTDRLGPYPARNIALRRIRGSLVAFLDADDWWDPTALEKLYTALVAGNANIAYCGWQNVGEGIVSEPYIPPAYELEDIAAHFLRTCPWPIHAALIRRTLVTQLEGFSERCYASMDYDFWLRCLATTRLIKRVPEVLSYYRWHNQGQVSSVKWRQVLDALDAQQSFIRKHPHLVSHLSIKQLRDLTTGKVLREAYRALWKRDLVSSQHLFRHCAFNMAFKAKDLPYIITALLPIRLYRGLVDLADRRRT